MKVFILIEMLLASGNESRTIPAVNGVFTDEAKAKKIAIMTHSQIFPMEVDYLYPGYITLAKEIYGNSEFLEN